MFADRERRLECWIWLDLATIQDTPMAFGMQHSWFFLISLTNSFTTLTFESLPTPGS
jgi:hypothetical protein